MLYLGVILVFGTLLGLLLWAIDRNRLTVGIWILDSALVLSGALLCTHGSWWGVVPLIIGTILILTNLGGPESTTDDPESKKWLLTFLGELTDIEIRRLTLTLSFPFRIVGFVPIDMEKVPHKFPLSRPITCTDDAPLYGFVAVTLVPDDRNLPGKSGGENLRDFINAGAMKGIKEHLDDLLLVWLQEDFGNHMDSREMEREQVKISRELHRRIRDGHSATHLDEDSEIDDISNLGVRFSKFNVVLFPTEAVQKARSDVLIENAQRRAEKVDTETMNQRIHDRLIANKADLAPGEDPLTFREARKQIYNESLAKAGNVKKIINKGGINFTRSDTRGGEQ